MVPDTLWLLLLLGSCQAARDLGGSGGRSCSTLRARLCQRDSPGTLARSRASRDWLACLAEAASVHVGIEGETARVLPLLTCAVWAPAVVALVSPAGGPQASSWTQPCCPCL